MTRLINRVWVALALASAGCQESQRSVFLLSDLPPDLARIALLRFGEGDTLIGSSGLMTVEQLPLVLEDDEAATIAVVGFTEALLGLLSLPEPAVLEANPIRIASAGDRLLPSPGFYRSAPLEPGGVPLADAPPPVLTVDWLGHECLTPVPDRAERVTGRGQLLSVTRMNERSALLIATGPRRTELFRADFERIEPIEPPGFSDEGGPGNYESSAAYYQDGRLWLASEPTEGITRVYEGTLEGRFELVATSTIGERVHWLAPDLQTDETLWILGPAGALSRVQSGTTTWQRHATVASGIPGRGGVAREDDGSFVVLFGSFANRSVGRISPDGTFTPFPLNERARPKYLFERQPSALFVSYDGLSTRLMEVQGEVLTPLPGSEDGVPTVEPLIVAPISGGFAISGINGFLSLFQGGMFCPVWRSALGQDTIEHIVELEDGLLSAPGVLRNKTGLAEITRVRFRAQE